MGIFQKTKGESLKEYGLPDLVFLFFFLSFFFFVFLYFLGPLPWPTEVPRLEV